jgi:DNA-binding NtrC family response regulator
VRELRNIVEYAASVCRDRRIRPEHLPDYLVKGSAPASAPDAPPAARAQAARPGGVRLDGLTGKTTWKDVERRLIMEALVECGGSRAGAATKLGWGRSTLWRKMKRHRIE